MLILLFCMILTGVSTLTIHYQRNAMNVKCELLNYKQDKSALDNLRVIIEDDGILSNQVRISIGEMWAVVRADELEKALSACTQLPY